MGDVQKLKKDYNKFAKMCKDKGMSPYQIFTVPTGANQEFFDALLEVFNKNIEQDLTPLQKTKVFDELYSEYRLEPNVNGLTSLSYGRCSKYSLPYDEFQKNFIDVLYILKELNSVGYIRIEDGKLKPINLKVNVETLTEASRLVSKSKYKLYEGLITPSGDFYVSLNEHSCMCMFMIANGVDMKGSLRITQMPEGNRQFSLSSCNYLETYSIKGFEDDHNIKITDEQAQSLYKFFKSIKKENKGGGQTLMQILARSINFGWDFLNIMPEDVNISLKHAKYNLQTFQDNMEGEFDGQALYRQVVAYSKQFGKIENES